MTRTKTGKNLLLWKCHLTMTKKDASISNEFQLQKLSLTYFHKNYSFFSATSNLCLSPMAYNTASSLDKLTCADYADFGKNLDRLRHFFWSENDNDLDVKLKVFKRDDNEEIRLVQNPLWEREISNSLFD